MFLLPRQCTQLHKTLIYICAAQQAPPQHTTHERIDTATYTKFLEQLRLYSRPVNSHQHNKGTRFLSDVDWIMTNQSTIHTEKFRTFLASLPKPTRPGTRSVLLGTRCTTGTRGHRLPVHCCLSGHPSWWRCEGQVAGERCCYLFTVTSSPKNSD